MKKLLLVILGISLVIESILAIGALVSPAVTMAAFKLQLTPDTQFLGHVVGWFLILVCVICGVAIRWIVKNKTPGWWIAVILGSWWVGIGISIYVCFARPDNLALDSLKGALILVTAWKSWPKS